MTHVCTDSDYCDRHGQAWAEDRRAKALRIRCPDCEDVVTLREGDHVTCSCPGSTWSLGTAEAVTDDGGSQ